MILVFSKASHVTLGIKSEEQFQINQKPEWQLKRSVRSFRNVEFEVIPNFELWTEDSFHLEFPQRPLPLTNFNSQEYETPDFSNGLAYPDPFLLTGQQAKRKVAYLYSRELFFGDIPHYKLLLRKQNDRKLSGVPVQRLGSIRINSPFDKTKFPATISSF
ncbi:uncharacterized protein isoform X2 [Leptinotarsa decemlineata]|nr:uncharacterized protein LOC111517791 [Leptinotarsa decemlineata]